jgi:hypothetical protein
MIPEIDEFVIQTPKLTKFEFQIPEKLKSPLSQAQLKVNEMMHSLSAKSNMIVKEIQPESLLNTYRDPQKEV